MMRRLLFLLIATFIPTFATAQSIVLRKVARDLSKPVYLTDPGDGSGRLFIVEQTGKIKILFKGRIFATPFLDLGRKISNGGERGLLGLAFAPDFRTSKNFYVSYTDTRGNSVIARHQVSRSNKNRGNLTGRTLMRVTQPFANHNGGCIQFGPDGKLYIALGDGGSGGDPEGNGQKTNTLLGKMLRINVTGQRGYSIPSDNPFVGDPSYRPEIFAFGLRNPWRFSFDRRSGRLFAGDVGQNALEEIDIIQSGRNYGWNTMEASRCFFNDGCDTTGLELPIAEYPRDEGASITGGYVYRGRQATSLVGKYVFGDFISGNVWTLTENTNGTWTRNLLLSTGKFISSFGVDSKNELYLLDYSGNVYQLIQR